jgi:hypothetical protein
MSKKSSQKVSTKNPKAGISGRPNPNYPSKTGNPSGKDRGNNTSFPKEK